MVILYATLPFFLGIELIKTGDSIFYTDNQKLVGTFHLAAVDVIKSLGLTPVFYMGADLSVKNTWIDRQIRDLFYKSRAVVIVLGKGEGWRGIEDVWAIPELPFAASSGIECLAYRTPEVSKAEIDALSLPVNPTEIENEERFKVALEQDLKHLMLSQG